MVSSRLQDLKPNYYYEMKRYGYDPNVFKDRIKAFDSIPPELQKIIFGPSGAKPECSGLCKNPESAVMLRRDIENAIYAIEIELNRYRSLLSCCQKAVDEAAND